jgi:hypothetical protein
MFPYRYSSYRLSARLQRTAEKRIGMETRGSPCRLQPHRGRDMPSYPPSDFISLPLLALPACSRFSKRFSDDTSFNMLDIATDTYTAYIQLQCLSSNPLNLRQLCPSQLSPQLRRARTSVRNRVRQGGGVYGQEIEPGGRRSKMVEAVGISM